MAVYAKDLDNNKELNQKLINDQLKIIDTLLLAEKKNFLVYELPAPFDFSPAAAVLRASFTGMRVCCCISTQLFPAR
ncbi:hypothetical protein KBNFDCII_00029 [African swine fever virus]